MKSDDDVKGMFKKATMFVTILALLWWFAVISLAFAVTLLIARYANARELTSKNITLKGRENVCKSLGKTAFDIIDLRDAGVSFEVFQEWIRARLIEAKGDPQSFIATDADIEFVVDEYRKVYTDKQMDGNKASLQVYSDCMDVGAKKISIQI
jgi:hypothetical protein